VVENIERVEFGSEYLEVVLRLRRLVPAWVESYVGPQALADAVGVGDEVSVDELRESVHEFGQRVAAEEEEPDRTVWLLAQLRAISAALLWLGGERLSYVELFERCHGARVERVPDQRFEHAHALLDRVLPGRGDVAARYRGWRETQLVPRERLREALDSLAGEMRSRCRESFVCPTARRSSGS